MNSKRQVFFCAAAFCAALTGVVTPARAVTVDVDLSGDFLLDNEIFTVNFSLDSDRLVTLFTSSWVSAGSGLGFDTALFLWDSAGNWLGIPSGYSDDAGLAGSALSNGTSYGYGEYDAFLNTFLGAGDYTATLMQTGNLPASFPGAANLAGGFTQDSEPNYTRDVFGWGTNPTFNGSAGNDPRTGNWALHLVGVSSYSIPGTPIPEPASLTLLALGAGCCAFRFRHKTKHEK